MNTLLLSAIIFLLVLGGIVLGSLLRRALPDHHLSKDSQEVVRLGVGLIATIGALVLGLLIASAKGSFDTRNGQIKQITANFILLDTQLAEYGPETIAIRQQLRSVIGPLADRLWHEDEARQPAPFVVSAAAEKIFLAIETLSPTNDLQKSLQARAIQVSTDLAQARLLLFAENDNAIPIPFIAILVFWLVIIFASFSLFAKMNATVFCSLALFALSASCAIFLILELSSPFSGVMSIPSAPLRSALAPLG